MAIASHRLVPPQIVLLTHLQSVTGPTALGRQASGAGAIVQLTPAELFGTAYRRGANIPDANTTVQPFTDRAGLYVIPGPLTANREITLGNTNFYAAAGPVFVLAFWRLDVSAFTLTVRRSDTTVIYTDPASPPANRIIAFTCSSAGIWTNNAIYNMQP